MWGGWGDVNVHVHLHHEVDATSHQGWGWGGWGDVNVHVHLHHEVDATSRQGWGWGGWGDVKFLHIERKITSVVHSHPPSHYIRAHALGWLYTGGDVHYLPAGDVHYWPTVCRKKFVASLPCPTCSAISMHVPVASFSAFATLHHLQVFKWRSVVCCLWHPTVSQGFCEELWMARAWSASRVLVMEGIEIVERNRLCGL